MGVSRASNGKSTNLHKIAKKEEWQKVFPKYALCQDCGGRAKNLGIVTNTN
jgi:hypothetical protein